MTDHTLQSNTRKELSEEVLEYLYSADVYRKFEKIASEQTSDPSKRTMLSVIIFRAMTGIDPMEDLPKNLESFFGITTEQVRVMLKKIGENILAAVSNQVPGLEQTLASWGAMVDESDLLAIEEKQPQTIDQFVRTFVKASPETMEPRIQHRLERLLVAYASKIATREQTIATFSKSEKTGGLGLDKDSVVKVLDEFDIELQKSEVVTEVKDEPELEVKDEPELEVKDEPEQVQESSVVQNEIVRPPKIVAFTKEDAEEIAHIREEKQHVVFAPKPILSEQDIVDRVCKNPEFHFDDPKMQERCINIVNSRVREVRSALKARTQLEKSFESGGLGVSGRKLADMMQILEEAFLEYQTMMRDKIIAEKKPKVLENKAEQKQEKLDVRYQDLTRQVRRAIDQTQTQIKHEAPVKKSIIRPNMKDVQFTKRLTGPIDELNTMTITEFRRLSENPVRASEKILSKIDLLEQQGYDKKVKGISAWRNSPLHKQYTAISEEALGNNLQVKDVIKTRKAEGGDILTLDEYMAVMKINSILRF